MLQQDGESTDALSLHASDEADFRVEFPAIPVNFVTTGGIMHDRFIVLDYGTADERFFHCGASSKDAAVKLTTAITEITSQDMKKHMHRLIDQMKGNPQLVLKWYAGRLRGLRGVQRRCFRSKIKDNNICSEEVLRDLLFVV